MGVDIHPTALVDPGAVLGHDVVVGPFAVVEAGTALGDGTRIDAHAIVRSGSTLGRGTVVHPFAVLGGAPQDRRHAGEATGLVVGDGNVFREHVTVHAGTVRGGGTTQVGDGGLFMVGAHVAHDCIVGDGVTLANGTLLGGHVVVEDHVVTGGHVAVAPFARIGTRAFLAGGAMVERSVPPFVIAAGDRARVRALNTVGLVRGGVDETSRRALEQAFRFLFRGRTPRLAAARSLADSDDPLVRQLAGFVIQDAAERRHG